MLEESRTYSRSSLPQVPGLVSFHRKPRGDDCSGLGTFKFYLTSNASCLFLVSFWLLGGVSGAMARTFVLTALLLLNTALALADPISGKILIGAVPIVTNDEFLKTWKPTFEDYLSETVGRALTPQAQFELVLFSLESIFDAVKESRIDFLFVNPSLFSCLEIEYSGIFSFISFSNFNC